MYSLRAFTVFPVNYEVHGNGDLVDRQATLLIFQLRCRCAPLVTLYSLSLSLTSSKDWGRFAMGCKGVEPSWYWLRASYICRSVNNPFPVSHSVSNFAVCQVVFRLLSWYEKEKAPWFPLVPSYESRLSQSQLTQHHLPMHESGHTAWLD